jgi:DNA transformation protein
VGDLLAPLGDVSIRRFFGGHGAFYQSVVFALIMRDTLYLRTDDTTRGEFEAAGSGPFTSTTKVREVAVRTYYRVPDEILEDAEDILAWSRRAVDVALRAHQAKAPKKRPAKAP